MTELLTLGEMRQQLKIMEGKYNTETNRGEKEKLKKSIESMKKAIENKIKEDKEPKRRVEKKLPETIKE